MSQSTSEVCDEVSSTRGKDRFEVFDGRTRHGISVLVQDVNFKESGIMVDVLLNIKNDIRAKKSRHLEGHGR